MQLKLKYRTSCLLSKNINLTNLYNIKHKTVSKKNVFYNIKKIPIKFKNIIKKNNLTFFFNNKTSFYYFLNNKNKFLFSTFFNNLEYSFKNKQKILFIDSNYKFILPIYNVIYKSKDLLLEKHFFFLETSYITKNNWIYLYKNFLEKYNVNILFFLNYKKFAIFFNFFTKFNLPIFSFFDADSNNYSVDYFFFISKLNFDFSRIVVYNNVQNIFFKYFNLNNTIIKFKFLNLYKNNYKNF